MDLKEEQELIAAARRNPQIFGKLYEEYYPGIFRYSLRRIADARIAEDITSETFFKALKNLWKFKWQNVPFSAWIYRIATNEINYYFRKGKYKPCSLESMMETGFDPPGQSDLETEIEEIDAQIKRHKDFLVIQQELKKLPVKYQEVIALRFFEDKKINEIAAILGKKEGTIKSLLSRGLDLLKEKWADAQSNSGMQPFSDLIIIQCKGQENNTSPKELNL
jgi:RNA polymerase sigma-70 factor, ECF subfamily